ncbi:spore germination protein [Paenibacillus sp. FSL K6-2524]|uniref:spore germination protein n=1 Tax=Paenibacillus sp. FSL K6-2524 TaxID=2954516 RepID=UPI001FE8AB18|nr:spore germination protein [Paenibacillus anaericanus]
MFDYSGRPDFVNDALLRGRLIMILDGSPVVLIAPSNLMQLLFAAEDPHLPFYFVFPWRMLRLVAIMLSILLPGFYTSLISYHQDQIPFPLLATIGSTRSSLPFSLSVEMFVILFILSLLREAGSRMPRTFSGSVFPLRSSEVASKLHAHSRIAEEGWGIMTRVKYVVILMSSLTFFLSGCWDNGEVQEINYLSAFGIDFQDGEYYIYAQMLDYESLSGPEGSIPSSQPPIWVGKGRGKTLAEATRELYTTSQQKLS